MINTRFPYPLYPSTSVMGVIHLPLHSNSKTIDMHLRTIFDIIMSKKRVLIESVFNILKNKPQLCHTIHRNVKNFCVHIYQF